jgi:hypothetical protein
MGMLCTHTVTSTVIPGVDPLSSLSSLNRTNAPASSLSRHVVSWLCSLLATYLLPVLLVIPQSVIRCDTKNIARLGSQKQRKWAKQPIV